jgi:N-acetylglucosaminyldiphosphoundecaprenol N-acetyl-beta-D-mannosaminyltransferase
MVARSQVDILGIRVDNVTNKEALLRMQGFIKDGRPHQVVTVNPEFIVTARRDPDFAQILNQADLALPDGQGLLWAARMLGTPLVERVTGADTLIKMAALSEKEGYRMYFLGASEGVAEAAAWELRRGHPKLQVVGTYAGSPARDEEKQIVDIIRQADPQVLFVAYGAPQQEKWIARNMLSLGVPLAVGVGGALDFISGRARRAPGWAQRLGLEWLYRLCREPWRWRRMLALPRFAYLVFRARLG